MLNPVQKIAATAYAGGEFDHVTSMADVRKVGDTLFIFIMTELGENPTSDLGAAVSQLDEVKQALKRERGLAIIADMSARDAMWWAIENGATSDLFFKLREKVREEVEA